MRYAIYDNGGKICDRYTLRLLVKPETFSSDTDNIKYLLRKYGKHFNEYFGFSENPFSPQGFGQYCGEYEVSRSYKHLGRKITLESLPDQAQKYVNYILEDYK